MYNDYQLADNLSAKAMRQKFDTIQSLESNDIREMHEKIRQQRDFLKSNNTGGKYDKIITKMDESLVEMGNIWQRTQSTHPNIKSNHLSDFLRNQGAKNQGKSAQLSNTNTSPETSEIPPQNLTSKPVFEEEPPIQWAPNSEENAIIDDNTNPLPEANNGDLNDSSNEDGKPNNGNAEAPNTGEIPPQNSDSQNATNTNNRNTYKRNFPMPGSILYRLSQSLFVNTRPQRLKDKQRESVSAISNSQKSNTDPNKGVFRNHTTQTSTQNREYPPYFGENPSYGEILPDANKAYFPPHQPPFESDRCDPREKCITNQLDILRLMLLFMALRPNCRYLPRICRIASTQLEILGEMVR